MPSFYPGGPDDILDADEPKQMEAMRDYIWTLGLPQVAKLAEPDSAVPAEEPAESTGPAPETTVPSGESVQTDKQYVAPAVQRTDRG